MSSNIRPLLTIVIATKNREIYCIEAIKSILSINSDKIEIAIADNSDSSKVKIFVESLNNEHLKYIYDSSPTSSIANFNRAMSLATGTYVCMIGDDDGINPDIIEVTAWALDNDVDAVFGSMSANYRWEGTGAPDTLFTKMTGSTLTITPFNGKAEIVDINQSLERFMKNGCTNYADYKLPRLYHGLVKRKFFDILKSETGDYLKGLSPDIYSSLALAFKIKKLVFLDYPITIPGVCGVSTSVIEGQKKSNSKKIEHIPHLKNRGDYSWSKYVPRFYCVQTIWADSGFAAIKEFGREDLIQRFNRRSLYAKILNADLSLISYLYKHIVDDCKSNSRFVSIEIMLTFLSYIKVFVKRNIFFRAYNRFCTKLRLKRMDTLTGLVEITQAMNALTDNISQRQIDYRHNLAKVENKI
ncbi:glycosyltransferase family 2 protein [Pedobacter sp. SL55]|uniref:glycosyltransferase family 2 protein n=1 Tax=Pedobacter sp. SL55 TaxID=2995161 RepID=UPI00226D7B4E|nr:glycosyltransferase [Pedobacter sp. SL55]WAC41452.1 glycosyltransferase [Pedobacter sp. SL55]